MFAIAVYDSNKRCGLLLRDHLGIKPLFLLKAPFGVAFASEAKAFHSLDQFGIYHPRQAASPLSPEATETATIGTYWEIPPGGKVEISAGTVVRVSQRAFNGIALRARTTKDTSPSVVLYDLLTEVVTAQMPESWDVGLLCSGGIDSMVITHIAQQVALKRHQRVRAYVLGHVAGSSDVATATWACAHRAVPIECCQVLLDTNDLIAGMSSAVRFTETFEPNVVRNSALAYHIFKRLAADGIRVALCGEGADELFWGYADFATLEGQEAAQTELMESLLRDLHKTQLCRVDRMSMAHSVEARVPFLDERIVSFARELEPADKNLRVFDRWLGKKVLRQAFSDVLPDGIVFRRKMTFSSGANFGDVTMNDNRLNQCILDTNLVTPREMDDLQKSFPLALPLLTPERALYLKLFLGFGYRVPEAYRPPVVAQLERN
jgi:asparagine synthase (glutamine-hydrolysing)